MAQWLDSYLVVLHDPDQPIVVAMRLLPWNHDPLTIYG